MPVVQDILWREHVRKDDVRPCGWSSAPSSTIDINRVRLFDICYVCLFVHIERQSYLVAPACQCLRAARCMLHRTLCTVATRSAPYVPVLHASSPKLGAGVLLACWSAPLPPPHPRPRPWTLSLVVCGCTLAIIVGPGSFTGRSRHKFHLYGAPLVCQYSVCRALHACHSAGYTTKGYVLRIHSRLMSPSCAPARALSALLQSTLSFNVLRFFFGYRCLRIICPGIFEHVVYSPYGPMVSLRPIFSSIVRG